MVLLLISSLALAHPMGSDLYGHRLVLSLGQDRIQADYTVEVPTPAMLRDLRRFMADAPPGTSEDAYGRAFRAELVDGLALRVDERPTAWQVEQETPDPGRADPRFVTARLHLSAAMPEGARTVQVLDGNLPDEASLFLDEVRASDALRVDATSLWDTDASGEIRHDRGGQWRMEEESRDLRVSFRRRPALEARLLSLVRALGGGPEAELGPARRRTGLLSSLDPSGATRLGLGLSICGLLGCTAAVAIRSLRPGGRDLPEGQGRSALPWKLAALAGLVCLLGGALFIWAGVQSVG